MSIDNIQQVRDEIYKLYSSLYTIVPKEASNLIFESLSKFDAAIKILAAQDKKE